MIGDVKKKIPPSSEAMANELKSQTVSLQNFKQQTLKRFEEIKEEFSKAMDQNNVAELDSKHTYL